MTANALATPDPAPFLAGIDAVAAQADRESDQSEAARSLSPALAAAMADAGAYRMLVPEVHGGLEVSPKMMMDALRRLAYGDGAAGWCAMIGATTGLLAASLPEETANTIFADPGVIPCGVTAPMGAAQRKGDRWIVSGRWSFASASPNAHWLAGGCRLLDEAGEAILDERGAPEQRLFFFRQNQVTRHDTWHVSGLCGTGSGDMSVEGLRLDEAFSVPLGSAPRVRTPLYRFPTFGLLALGVASVAIGLGERALDEWAGLAQKKAPAGSRRRLAERAPVQLALAKAEAQLGSARAFMEQAADEAWACAAAGEKLSAEHRRRLRLAASHGTWAAAEATGAAYHGGGGSAIYAQSRLQRCFRDVNVTTQHIMVGEPTFELAGRGRLGLPLGGPF